MESDGRESRLPNLNQAASLLTRIIIELHLQLPEISHDE